MPRLFLGVLALALLLPLLLLACGGSDEPTNGTSQGGVAPSIQEQRDRANSDDAESIDEVQLTDILKATPEGCFSGGFLGDITPTGVPPEVEGPS